MSVPEVRRLLWRLLWAGRPATEHTLHWSRWRRCHQARARRAHYRRHLARAP